MLKLNIIIYSKYIKINLPKSKIEIYLKVYNQSRVLGFNFAEFNKILGKFVHYQEIKYFPQHNLLNTLKLNTIIYYISFQF